MLEYLERQSNIQQTYCIPMRDMRLGFRTARLYIQSDRDNILISVFKHPRIIKLESQLKVINQLKFQGINSQTQTNISHQLSKFILDLETNELERQGSRNQILMSQYSQKHKQIKYSNYCNTIIQTMLTGKNMDSLEQSTNTYIKSLEDKIKEGQVASPFRKKKDTKQYYPSIVPHFELVHSGIQTDQDELINIRVSELEKQLFQIKITLQSAIKDNVQLLSIKYQHEKNIKHYQQQITELHSQISKTVMENSRLKSKESILSRKVIDQPVREKSSSSTSKKAIGQVKLVELQALQEENRVLRQYIQTIKAQSPTIKGSKNKLNLFQNQTDIDITQFKQKISKLQLQNKSLSQKCRQASKKIYQLQQMKDIIDQNSNELPDKFQNLQHQNVKLQQKIILLEKEVQSQKQYSNLLKTQNQNIIIDLKKTTHFGQQEYTKLNYKRLVQIHDQQSKELKNSQLVIRGLRQIIRQYQDIIDQKQAQEDNSITEEYSDRIDYMSEMINNQLAHLNDLISHQRPNTQRSDDINNQVNKIMNELKKEYNKRMLLQNKLQRLSHTLMEYEEEILEKTARISDLNYTILQLQQKSQASDMSMTMSFSDDYSSIYPNNRFQYDYKTVKDFRKTKYDLAPIQHNASQEDTITESRIRQQLDSQQIKSKPSKMSKFNKKQQQSLKLIITKNILTTNKQKLSLILQIVECVEKNISLWRFQLTSNNLMVKSKNQVYINTSQPDDADPLYSSPQELYQVKSQNSAVWRLGIIIDELIHGTLFFETMQEIVDSKILYKFRSKEPEYEPIKKLLGKALIKNNSLRINMLKFLSGVKLQLKSRHY